VTSPIAEVFAATAGVIALGAVGSWLISLVIRDATIADVFWGSGHAAVAWVSVAVSGDAGARGILLATLTAVWGGRLTLHLAARSRGRPEDPRYAAMRRRHGRAFGWVSLFTVFGFQGAVMWIVSLPIQLGALARGDLGPLAFTGAAVCTIGIAIETVADHQLARFRAVPANVGAVMNRGLWSATRHPNYFGDFLVWWGLFAVAIRDVSQIVAAIGPIVMTIMLLRVSGVTLLERSLAARHGWADYQRTTPAFFPRIPRRRR
jgi:steroid 5-alpha reductase family enzyme